jgi:hypothetical protein
VHLRESPDHFAHDLALWRGQAQKRIKRFAHLAADAVFPTFAVLA